MKMIIFVNIKISDYLKTDEPNPKFANLSLKRIKKRSNVRERVNKKRFLNPIFFKSISL